MTSRQGPYGIGDPLSRSFVEARRASLGTRNPSGEIVDCSNEWPRVRS